MKFSIGDRILIKRTGEEGVLLSFINKQMVEVRVENVDFPVHLDEIDHPYLKWFTAPPGARLRPSELPVEKSPPPRPPQGLHLSFLLIYKGVGGEDLVDYFKIHLVNELPYTLHFAYEARSTSQSLFGLSGSLQPFTSLHLHNLDFETVSETPRFIWRARPVEDDKKGPEQKGELRIRPPKLFAFLQKAAERGDPTFSVLLLQDFVEQEKEPLLTGKLLPKPIPRAPLIPKDEYAALPTVIDLHLSALLGEGETLERAEALNLQLRVLRYALDEALAAAAERMIIIHGLGRGVLRNAVHALLKKTPGVKKFSADWHAKYGFGATEVWFAYADGVA